MIIDFLLDDIRKAIAGLEDEVSGLTAESFASVDYVSSAKTIYFYNAVDEEVGSIDTTDFVVDGMIDTVNLSGNVLHFVFNTDAGKQPIDVDLSSVMPDLSAYWTSAETQSAITAVEDHLFDVEQVTASALTELHDDVLELSARTVDLSPYYTSAQTENAISAATSGKADAANVTPKTGRNFPEWNAQGIITGSTQMAWLTNDIVNGKVRKQVLSNDSSNGFAIYAPESAGTAGQILVSAGNGAPVWANDDKVSSTSVSTIWKGTQAEYDAITTKDPNTFYIIVSN